MRLIEPVGLLEGAAARAAIEAGLAAPLAGNRLAFLLARLIDPDAPFASLAPVGDVAEAWGDALRRLAARPPPWAGLEPSRPSVMGILNVTPDSFSDGGVHADPDRAIDTGLGMAEAGADLVDVGGESTRPGAPPVPPAAERARVLPVIAGLARQGVRVSVDTRNATTMAAALDAGARVVNDISGLAHDPGAAPLVAARGCPVVLMHMRGEPQTMNSLARYDDVSLTVFRELAERVAAAERAGIVPEAIAVDPGIGFAKTAPQNLALLVRLPLLLNLGRRILVGASRKSFLGRLAEVTEPAERGPASLAAGLFSLSRGASILRVHDVPQTVQAVRVWQSLAA